METRPYLLHALSPLHVGTGQGVGIIDLPLARMRATGIPIVPGSSLKGVLRAALASREAEERHAAVFGPLRTTKDVEGDNAALDHAGALVVSDARLLALPVRAFVGTFAYVTSPLLLELARRDFAGQEGFPSKPLKPPEGRRALVAKVSESLNARATNGKERLYLEELDLQVEARPEIEAWAAWIARALPEPERALFAKRFTVVDDETMDFLAQTAVQIDTRIRLDSTKGTVAEGALWTEESLPAETLLVGVMAATSSLRGGVSLSAREVLDYAFSLSQEKPVQIGGKATVGRGLCRLRSWSTAAGGKS